jgi:hypothetical protein
MREGGGRAKISGWQLASSYNVLTLHAERETRWSINPKARVSKAVCRQVS